MENQILLGKNAIIKITIGLLLVQLHLNAQQKLLGTYCVDYELNDISKCLKFYSNNYFSYNSEGDLGTLEFGQGKYNLKDGLLILNYSQTKLDLFSGYHRVSKWINSSKNIQIQFKVMDINGTLLRNINIYLPNEEKICTTNKNGECSIQLKKNDEQSKVEVVSIGYDEHFFNIRKDLNYKINIYLKENTNGLPIKNQIDTLDVIKNNEKILILKSRKNNRDIRWVKTYNN